MWGISLTLQRIGGWGAEAADGCTKWIFLVCNEAASSASLWGEERRGVLGKQRISGNKGEEVGKSDMQMWEGEGDRGQQPVIAGETGEEESLGPEIGKTVVGRNRQGSGEVFHNLGCPGPSLVVRCSGDLQQSCSDASFSTTPTQPGVRCSKTKPRPAAETRD